MSSGNQKGPQWREGFGGAHCLSWAGWRLVVWPTKRAFGYRASHVYGGGAFEIGNPRYAPTLEAAKRRAERSLPAGIAFQSAPGGGGGTR